MRTLTRKSGFTLIELVVIIGTLAIVAAMFFPVLARARDNAARANCMGNLKQLGLATRMYLQDSDGRFFSGSLTSNAPCPGNPSVICTQRTWSNLLFPYTKSLQVFNCPSDKTAQNNWTGLDRTAQNNVSYGYNNNLGSRTTLADIKQVSQTALMADTEGKSRYKLYKHGYPSKASLNQTLNTVRQVSDRHMQGADYLFVDGHVKWFSIKRYANLPIRTVHPTVDQGIYYSADASG